MKWLTMFHLIWIYTVCIGICFVCLVHLECAILSYDSKNNYQYYSSFQE